MINWDQINYNETSAQIDFELFQNGKDIKQKKNFFLDELRNELVAIREKIFFVYNIKYDKIGYNFDLPFALELYELLNSKYGFSVRYASDDDIWRYISLKVIPDIVHIRWGYNVDRFYKQKRRIWLKTLWWYIHLSWAGSKELTRDILIDKTTDTIVQLVERVGVGYNLNLSREIMKQYYYISDSSREIFRAAMVLNTARLEIVIPEMASNGIKGYVSSIFNDVIGRDY